ncbi:MAG: PEGA domain-containing protein [Polyangiaceae bacterium]
MNTTWKTLAVAAALLAVIRTPALRAEDEPEHAASLRKEANAAADAKDWKTCREKASEAWKITPSPLTAGTLGICETELGEFASAAEHLDYALRLDDVPARREAVTRSLEKAKKGVATVSVTVKPAGAHVRVGTEDKGPAPVVVYVMPGTARISAQKDGFEPKAIDVDAKPGASVPLSIELLPVAEPTGARPLWPALVLGSLGVVGLGVGAGLAVAANGRAADAEAAANTLGTSCPPSPSSGPCAEAVGAADDRNLLSNVSMATLLTGGLLAASSVGLFVWAATGPKAAASQTSWVMAPIVTRTEVGLSVFGSF